MQLALFSQSRRLIKPCISLLYRQQTYSMATSTSSSEVRKIKVYTKTGDKGTSSFYNGQRRSKDDDVFWALGDTDELNSAIGIAACYVKELDPVLFDRLGVIQSRLLDVGSNIATPMTTSTPEQVARIAFEESHVALVESWIDEMEESLPPLKNFILPSGGLASSHLHLARTIARRAERRIVTLYNSDDVKESVMKYANRLSDFFFVAARYAAQKDGQVEVVYKMSRPKKLESEEKE